MSRNTVYFALVVVPALPIRRELSPARRVDQPSRCSSAAVGEIFERGGTPIVNSQLGKPKGERDTSLSLRQVADELIKALDGIDVFFAEDFKQAHALLGNMEPGTARAS